MSDSPVTLRALLDWVWPCKLLFCRTVSSRKGLLKLGLQPLLRAFGKALMLLMKLSTSRWERMGFSSNSELLLVNFSSGRKLELSTWVWLMEVPLMRSSLRWRFSALREELAFLRAVTCFLR